MGYLSTLEKKTQIGWEITVWAWNDWISIEKYLERIWLTLGQNMTSLCPTVWLTITSSLTQECQIWNLNLVRLAPNGTNLGFFKRSVSVHFGSPSQNVLKLILKSPIFVPFGPNMTQFGCQIYDHWCRQSLAVFSRRLHWSVN